MIDWKHFETQLLACFWHSKRMAVLLSLSPFFIVNRQTKSPVQRK